MNNKIIDFHAHIFPEKIAAKASASIGEFYSTDMAGNGTVEDLLQKGKEVNIVKYVVHSTATKADQVSAVNDFIRAACDSNDEFIGFGTLHPDFRDLDAECERMRSFNLKGIKLHPEFQGFSIDDSSMMDIYKICERRFPVLIHVGDNNLDSSNPRRLLRIIEEFPDLTIIAAHLGAYRIWDDSSHVLADSKVYFDTSSSLYYLEPEKATEIIRRLGTDRIVFGTDYPMWSHESEMRRFKLLGLNEVERENILWKNAARLLKLNEF